MSLASRLTVLTHPWTTGITMVLLGLTGGGLLDGEDLWVAVVTRVSAAFSWRVLGVNFLRALGLAS